MALLAGVQSYEDLKDTSFWVPVTYTAVNISETPKAWRIGAPRKEDRKVDPFSFFS